MKPMNDTTRLILALMLGLVVIGGWQIFYVAPIQKERAQYYAEQKKQQEAKQAKDIQDGKLMLEGVLAEGKKAKDVLLDRGEALLESATGGRVKISSPRLHGSIALTGARFDDLTLADYKISLEKDSPEVVLFSPQGSKDAYFTDLGWLAGDDSTSVPGKDSVWHADHATLTPEQPVTLSWNNGKGLTFSRKIELDKDFMFTITDTVKNSGGSAVTLFPYGLINRTRPDTKSYAVSHEGAVGVFGEVLEENTYDELKKQQEKNREGGKFTFESNKGWFGFADKYWLSAIIPAQDAGMTITEQYYANAQGQKRYQVHFRAEGREIGAGKELTLTQRIFAGAKEVKLLDRYEEEFNIPLFDRAVDFGVLYFLTRPMFALLHFLFGLLGNFGVAILVMTVIVKLILFPLANKSYASMARLKDHMPEMMKIKERYANDKPKMNQEMMKFYQENKINPMAGCLPILAQIPIFFALYKVIFIAIEMRHAPFYWWIHDLSAPDTTNVINLFGLLPFAPPSWMPAIGALSCMFAITMAIQQRLSPPPADPTQKMIMNWMPVFLLFVFAGFPAGLVVYWVWSNMLSIVQQYVITRHIHKVEK